MNPARQRTRLAIIGAGLMGAVHARAFARDGRAEIVAIIDVDAAAASALAARHEARPASSLSNLPWDDVDLFVIATPPSTHVHLATIAAAAGKPVLLEKPVCLSKSEAERLLALSGACRVLPANNFWFSNLWARAQAAIRDLGPPLHMAAFFQTPGPHRGWLARPNEGGIVHDLGAHCLGLALMTFGHEGVAKAEEIASDSSDGYARVEFALSFPGNRLGAVRLSWLSGAQETWTVSVDCEHGFVAVEFAPAPRLRVSLRGAGEDHWEPDLRDPETDWIDLGGYHEQASAALDFVRDGVAFPVPLQLACAGVVMAEAVRERVVQGKREEAANPPYGMCQASS